MTHNQSSAIQMKHRLSCCCSSGLRFLLPPKKSLSSLCTCPNWKNRLYDFIWPIDVAVVTIIANMKVHSGQLLVWVILVQQDVNMGSSSEYCACFRKAIEKLYDSQSSEKHMLHTFNSSTKVKLITCKYSSQTLFSKASKVQRRKKCLSLTNWPLSPNSIHASIQSISSLSQVISQNSKILHAQ